MKTIGIVFSNIYDNRLSELTNVRTIASLPFGSRYRLIDFVLSNMSNSGIYKIGIITKYNYRSLMDHLGNCSDWDLNRKNEGVVILPPFAVGNTGVYRGKLEALYNASPFLHRSSYDTVVICDSTVICNIDFRPVVEQHLKSGCDVTAVVYKEDKLHVAKRPFLVKTNKKGVVTEMLIDSSTKPDYLTGTGMFVFKREYLLEMLEETHEKGLLHFETDYLQQGFNSGKVKIGTYMFDGIVLQNLDRRSYYENNMLLLDKKVSDGLFRQNAPIYTKVHDEAPSYYAKGSEINNCMIADGCEIRGTLNKCIVFRDVKVGPCSNISASIIMQSARIGKNVDLRYVILDKDVTVKDGTVLIGTRSHPIIIQKGETV